jgi:hypothetical protein
MDKPMTKVKISLDDLTDDEAYALAQMCRRLIWNDFDRLSAKRVGMRRHGQRNYQAATGVG